MKTISLRTVFFFSCFCLFQSSLYAQQSKDSTDVPQKDLIDVLHTVLKKKTQNSDTDQNLGQHTHLSIVPAVGYTLQNGFSVSLSSNASFLNSRQQSQNMSVINGGISFTQKHQFTLVAQSNLWAKENKMNLVGDYRFLIYPQATYGLGGHTKLSEETLINYDLLRFSQSVYFKIRPDVYAGVGYNLNYHYKIHEAAATNLHDADLTVYEDADGNTYNASASALPAPARTISSGLLLNFLIDKRRNANNPIAGGQYLNVQLQNNLTMLGSDDNWEGLVVDSRKYIGAGKKSKLALWTYGWFTFNNHAPYLDLPSTGWDTNGNLGRGYVQGRFRGKNLLYSEAEYRMVFSRSGLLGGVVFANAQSVTDWPSNRFTTVHPGFGSGLRIKFNKHSNANIALDYAFGTDGSKGVFVNLGEVF